MQLASSLHRRWTAHANTPFHQGGIDCRRHATHWLQPHRALAPDICMPLIDLADANVFGQAWGTSVDVSTLVSTAAPQIFAVSIFPYAGFLYCLTRSGKTPPIALFGTPMMLTAGGFVHPNTTQAFTFYLRLYLPPSLPVSTPSKPMEQPWPMLTGCTAALSHCSPSPTCWYALAQPFLHTHTHILSPHTHTPPQVVLGFRKAIRDAEDNSAAQEDAVGRATDTTESKL